MDFRYTRKVDDYYRIYIGAELCKELKFLNKADINIYTDNDTIIIKRKNTPKDIENIVSEAKPNKLVVKTSVAKKVAKIKEVKNKALNNTTCSLCDRKIGISRFILNDEYICRKCRDKLKDSMFKKFSKRRNELK